MGRDNTCTSETTHSHPHEIEPNKNGTSAVAPTAKDGGQEQETTSRKHRHQCDPANEGASIFSRTLAHPASGSSLTQGQRAAPYGRHAAHPAQRPNGPRIGQMSGCPLPQEASTSPPEAHSTHEQRGFRPTRKHARETGSRVSEFRNFFNSTPGPPAAPICTETCQTNWTRCVVCKTFLTIGEKRVGRPTYAPDGPYTPWHHPRCWPEGDQPLPFNRIYGLASDDLYLQSLIRPAHRPTSTVLPPPTPPSGGEGDGGAHSGVLRVFQHGAGVSPPT